MKQHLESLLKHAVEQLKANGTLPDDCQVDLRLERTRDKAHGDFASNLALILSKAAKRKPRDLAESIVAAIPASPEVEGIDIAGPGFINFKLNAAAYHELINAILAQKSQLGSSPRITRFTQVCEMPPRRASSRADQP